MVFNVYVRGYYMLDVLFKVLPVFFGEKLILVLPALLLFYLMMLWIMRSFVVFRAERIGVHEIIWAINISLTVAIIILALIGLLSYISVDLALGALEVLLFLTPLFIFKVPHYLEKATGYLRFVHRGFPITRLLFNICTIMLIFVHIPTIMEQTLGILLGALLAAFIAIDVLVIQGLVMLEATLFENKKPFIRLILAWIFSLLLLIVLVVLA